MLSIPAKAVLSIITERASQVLRPWSSAITSFEFNKTYCTALYAYRE